MCLNLSSLENVYQTHYQYSLIELNVFGPHSLKMFTKRTIIQSH